MRIRAVLGIVAAAAVALSVGLLTPATGQSLPNTFTVVKVVEGPVPAGTVFEVTVTCESFGVTSPPSEGFSPQTVQFDEDGNPLNDNSFEVDLFVDCHAEETATGGAAVSYACDVVVPTFGAPADEGTFVPAECLDDQTVRFDEVVDAEGTITVTNRFEEEPPPPPVVDDDDDVQGDVVTATPPFTG